MVNKANVTGAKMICKSIDTLTKEVRRLRADIKSVQGQQGEIAVEIEMEERDDGKKE